MVEGGRWWKMVVEGEDVTHGGGRWWKIRKEKGQNMQKKEDREVTGIRKNGRQHSTLFFTTRDTGWICSLTFPHVPPPDLPSALSLSSLLSSFPSLPSPLCILSLHSLSAFCLIGPRLSSPLSPSFVPRSLHSFVPSSLRLFVPLSLVRPSFPTFLCPISGLGVCPVGGCKMCPDDWLYFSFPDYGPGGMYGHYCYKNHPTSSTWTTANDNCNVLSFNPWKVLS